MDLPVFRNLSSACTVEGMVNRVPLCVAKGGGVFWARRRDSPYALESTGTDPTEASWTTVSHNGSPYNMGPCK